VKRTYSLPAAAVWLTAHCRAQQCTLRDDDGVHRCLAALLDRRERLTTADAPPAGYLQNDPEGV